MKKIGVTGAAGFIGSHVCERLLADGNEVVAVDDLSYGSVGNIAGFLHNSGFSFEVLDCTRQRDLRRAFDGCDAIIHLAAKKIPRFGGTLRTLEVNVQGMDAACGVALSLDADLVITSTSDVYGNATPPFSEDGDLVIGPPTTKRWAYAVSKMYDEHYALALAEYLTLIKDSHANQHMYEAAAEHLTPGQLSAVTWVAMAINTFNRIAISSSYRVAPTLQR